MASLIRRNGIYYLDYYVGSARRRRSLGTPSLQIAKEYKRQFESARIRGTTNPLPTRTPISEALERYVKHVRVIKTAKSAQTDVYYLREAFGPVCDALRITSRRVTEKVRKRPLQIDAVQDLRARAVVIEAESFESITTGQISAFISGQVRRRGLAPKTANRYREILVRLYNWMQKEGDVRLPGGVNPGAAVERYRERAPQISFLTLPQIDEQLRALTFRPQLRAMVAMLIYAGVRREELLWLTAEDIDWNTGPYGTIRVRAKSIAGEKWEPKTKRNRAVSISSSLRAILNEYRRPESDHEWFFPSPDGKRWDPDNFSADLRDANAKAKLNWSSLDYRHTFGSQLAMKGESLYKISTLMGNSPEICRRHYAALLPESLSMTVEFPDQFHKEVPLRAARTC